ncbi:S8 family peptidase [Paracrocinitomix mangrovi]|uniref:S8 family peptidase n=1 Tax=Paracrocinitomix mangrovi TaxID=2862509 RepID=UPI001C8E2D05|nr:S8 family peptidase [Paracrocinitomix mangrovi]UKN02583.1 S8 family peptidase [Paracrocinitomix mangrovi]
MRRIVKLIAVYVVLIAFSATAQDYDKKKLNWYNGAKYGMNTENAYKKLLSGRKSEKVVVAVIDSGVDIEHEDLQGSIWTNADEIPGNGIDDDKNGYIDDVHGWNFLGNADGENVNHEQLEMTRMLKGFEAKYGGKEYSDLSDDEKKEYDLYKKLKEEVAKGKGNAEKTMAVIGDLYDKTKEADEKVKKKLGKDSYTLKELKKLKKDDEVGTEAEMLYGLAANGLDVETLKHYTEIFQARVDYHYNVDYDARKIIGDDPANFDDKFYGNNDVEGPDAMHGTHCSGIIAATRGNGIGNDGVADNVWIMSIRTVPDGDERDKDVALAIRYAVDNGAQVVNMSYGKSYSPYKDEVIAAIRYAEEKGVLLIHAAGNDGKDIGENDNFPSPKYDSMDKEFTNWIEVGASTRYGKPNAKKGVNGLAASFSNYSEKEVDIYAPGLEIYSTVPQSDYEESQGTSMAAPMVTGLAALLKSYFPKLTMFEIRDIILASGQDVSEVETTLPGDETKTVPFKALCETGKIANVYNAVEMAIEMESKK